MSNDLVPVRNNGIDTKNPPIAQFRVVEAPFKYLVVLQKKNNINYGKKIVKLRKDTIYTVVFALLFKPDVFLKS